MPAQRPFWNRVEALGMFCAHTQAASHWLGILPHTFPILGLLQLCGVFKARRDGLQGGHSVEVDMGGSSACWRFGLSLKVATLLSPGSLAVVPTALPCIPMGFLGG